MAVTYIEEDFSGWTKVKLPVLHKVHYTDTGEPGMIFRLDQWCAENCKGRRYHSPGWTDSNFVEFEDDEDAMLFALRWS